jgi:hypothetical protein
MHTLPTHVCADEQACPHVPQLLLSKPTLRHVPLQSSRPVPHSHAEFTQVRPPKQISPHAPQLALSLARLTHAPPGHVV